MLLNADAKLGPALRFALVKAIEVGAYGAGPPSVSVEQLVNLAGEGREAFWVRPVR